MTSTYFTDFYKNIYLILIVNQGIAGQSSSLVTTSESNLNRANLYLNDVSSSKWQESGASIFKTNIVMKISQNMKELCDFLAKNLNVACKLSINNLLPKLIEMKDNDETLTGKRSSLQSARSSLSYQESHMPSRPYKDEKGVWHGETEYNNALSELNRLKTVVNNLIIEIQKLIVTLDGIKVSIDGYIMQISTLGNENIVIPGFSLPSDISAENLIPLEQEAIVPNITSMNENGYFDESTGIYYEKIEGTRDIRVVLPDGRQFIQYCQSYARQTVNLSDEEGAVNHVPVCGPCAYASALSFFGLGIFTPESVGYAVKQFSSFSALNKLINGGYNIKGTDKSRYLLTSLGVDGKPAKTLMMNPDDNQDLHDYIQHQAELKGQTFNQVASQAKRDYLRERITETLEQGGVVTVRTSVPNDRKALSLAQSAHFVTIMGIDKTGNLIISNSTATSIAGENSPFAINNYTREIDLGGMSYRIPEITLDQFINNNIMGCKGRGNSITCIVGVEAEPITMQADAGGAV